MPSFIIVGHMSQILGRGTFCPPIREQPQEGLSWTGLREKKILPDIYREINLIMWAINLLKKIWEIKFVSRT